MHLNKVLNTKNDGFFVKIFPLSKVVENQFNTVNMFFVTSKEPYPGRV